MSEQVRTSAACKKHSSAAGPGLLLQRKCDCGRHTGGGEWEACKNNGSLQRQPGRALGPMTGAVHAGVVQTLSRAAAEASTPIHEPLRSSLGDHIGQDLSYVKVHSGAASADAAEFIGARAYTLGTDIHLGKESHSLSRSAFDRLIAHEAIHTVQQGGGAVTPHTGLTVSDPHDAAEQEADHIAESVTRNPIQFLSRSLALRDQMRASMPGQHIGRSVSPQIQRDLTGKYPTAGGDFNLNLKTESHPGGVSGMKGTISFKAGDAAPDSTNIRLLQTVKTVNLRTGKDVEYTGGEANRNKTMTSEDKASGVEGGWFVDHSAAMAKQRTTKKDPAVSPYYRDYWPNPTVSHDGSKKGKAVVEASLWDSPGSSGNTEFSFETAAKASDTGHVYGTVMWGFAVKDASKGKIEKEGAVGRDVTLSSSAKALEKFNEFYKNPGAPTAPAK
jgi:hypothetical protein